MPLQKQPQTVPILGLDTHADPKAAPLGVLDIAENVWFKRAANGSGVEARKRLGTTALTRSIQGGSSISTGRRLATYKDERLQVSDVALYSYSPQLAKWVSKAGSTAAGVTAEPLVANRLGVTVPDSAAIGNIYVAVYELNGSVQYTVIDLATGERIVTDAAIGGVNPRIVALASSFIIFTASAGSVLAYKIDTSTPTTISGSSSVAATLNASNLYDVIRNGSNDSVLVAHHTTTPNVRIAIWNSNMTLGSTVTLGENAGVAIAWMTWDFSDANGYLGTCSAATGTKVSTIAQSPLAVSSTSTVDAAWTAMRNMVGFRTQAVGTVVYGEASASPTYNTLINRNGAALTWARSVGLASRVFKVGSTHYVMLAYESTLQPVYFLLSLDNNGNPLFTVKSFYGTAGGLTAKAQSLLATPVVLDSTTFLMPALRLPPLARRLSVGGTSYSSKSLWYLRVDLSGAGLSAPKQLGEQLHLPGGIINGYDGNAQSEVGFHLIPEKPTLTPAVGAGLLDTPATYNYYAVYEWIDGHGQIHQSAPSPVATVALAGGQNQVTVAVPTYRINGHPGLASGAQSVLIAIYRTEGGGTTPYKITSELNSGSADTISYLDQAADGTITSNQQLYTLGGVLPHIPAPSAKLLEVWRNRLFLLGTEDPLSLWVSNMFQLGEGVSFSDALVLTLEADGGYPTAMIEMDDRLLIFKAESIYQLTGTGPTPNGDNQYDQPARISATVGAISQAGVVKMRDGVMFKSAKGFFLLPFGASSPVKLKGVEAKESLTVTGACVMKDLEQVRFVTSDGTTLVYHYGLKDAEGMGIWSTFTGQAAVDCISWNGKFAYLASDGTVKEEVSGQWGDDGSNVTSKVRWARIAAAGLFGRFKLFALRLLGEMMASFTISVTTDISIYGAVVTETTTKAVTTSTLDPVAVQPAQERCEALQVTVQETSTTEGFRISGLGLEVGLKSGANKQPSGQFTA